MEKRIYIGTSGWHYKHWRDIFYPPEITGYNELRFFAERFGSVENNSSFYRIASANTYKTWSRMTPPGFKFSLKLNKSITHLARLKLSDEIRETVIRILTDLQVLEDKLGALVVQLPPSFKPDYALVTEFLEFLTDAARSQKYAPDLAIEFRHKDWFAEETYVMLRKYNVALVAAQSSRYPSARERTADTAYIRLHGPKELFASPYSTEELKGWATYIRKEAKKGKVYVYFNNDFHGHALNNAAELSKLLKI